MKGESMGSDVVGSSKQSQKVSKSKMEEAKKITDQKIRADLEKHRIDADTKIKMGGINLEHQKIDIERKRVEAAKEGMKKEQELQQNMFKFKLETETDKAYKKGMETVREMESNAPSVPMIMDWQKPKRQGGSSF